MTAAMNAPLFAGASLVLLPRFEVEAVMETIQNEKVTSFCGVPTMYIAVIHHPRRQEVQPDDRPRLHLRRGGISPRQ